MFKDSALATSASGLVARDASPTIGAGGLMAGDATLLTNVNGLVAKGNAPQPVLEVL